jgi:hypothetical protein
VNLDQAKKLMSLQSCITYFCDRFLDEVASLPESVEKAQLTDGMKEVIGVNLAEVIMPITGAHSSVNPYVDNPIAQEWFRDARKKALKHAVRQC